MPEKQVSIGWQVMATIFIPTGLYAFKRINKLRYGILIYGITFTLLFMFGSLFVYESVTCDYSNGIEYCEPVASYTGAMALLTLASYITPMLIISRWSKSWNKKINQQSLKTANQ